MPKGEVTWQDKLCSLEGGRRKGVSTRIAERLGEKMQTVYHWIEHGMTPRDLDDVLERAAKAYGTTRAWLRDGQPGPPPIVGRAADAALVDAIAASSLSEERKQILYALTDDDAAEFLVEQLRVYRATVARRRRA